MIRFNVRSISEGRGGGGQPKTLDAYMHNPWTPIVGWWGPGAGRGGKKGDIYNTSDNKVFLKS